MALEDAAAQLASAPTRSADAAKALRAVSPWHVASCEGAASLDVALATLEARAYEVRFVLPNGVNRWTVIARKRDGQEHP